MYDSGHSSTQVLKLLKYYLQVFTVFHGGEARYEKTVARVFIMKFAFIKFTV